MHSITSAANTLEILDWKTVCSSLKDVVEKDDPELLREYLNQDPRRLYQRDSEQNSLLILLLMGKAFKCAKALLLEYEDQTDANHKNMQDRGALHYACVTSDKTLIGLLIRNNASILEQDSFGWTPLHIAISGNNTQIIQLLSSLEQCNFLCLNRLGPLFEDHRTNPLHLAARTSFEMTEAIVPLTQSIDAIDEEGKTALHHAITSPNPRPIVVELLRKSANPNIEDINGKTPLGLACQTGNYDLVDFLLHSRAEPNKGALPPLAIAYSLGFYDIAKLLILAGAKTDLLIEGQSLYDISLAVDDRQAMDALSRIPRTPTTDLIGRCKLKESQAEPAKKQSISGKFKTLFKPEARPADDGTLFILCQKGTLDEVHRYIENKGDPYTKDLRGNTLLHAALAGKNTLVYCYLMRHFRDLVNQPNDAGETPLHLAVSHGNSLACKLLLQFGADANAQDKNKNCPLHKIATSDLSKPAMIHHIIDLLLAKGGFLEAFNAKGQTPVMVAAEYGQVNALEHFLRRGASVNAIDIEKKTMLIRACEMGNHTLAQKLIFEGADENVKGPTTALNAACRIASLGLVNLLLNPKACAKDKKSATADPNRWVENQSPLSITIENMLLPSDKAPAVASVLQEIAKQLLEHGAQANKSVYINDKKIKPIKLALERQLTELARLLIAHEAKVPKNLTAKARELLQSAQAPTPRLVPLLRVPSWDDMRQRMTAQSEFSPRSHSPSSESPHSPLSSARPLLLSTVSGNDIAHEIQSLTIARAIHDYDILGLHFSRENTLDDRLMRQAHMLASQPLLQQRSRTIPGSLVRLPNKMAISIEGQLIATKDMVYAAEGRDGKARELVIKLINAINHTLGSKANYDRVHEKLALLTKMDGIDDELVKMLDVYKPNGDFVPANRYVIALKLLTKEAACIAIIPVQTQLRLYSEKHHKKIHFTSKLVVDQWEEINVIRVEHGFKAFGKTTVGLEAREKGQKDNVFGAKLQVNAEITVVEETGSVTIKLRRSRIEFGKDATPTMKEHIYNALNDDITYETSTKKKA